MFVLLLLWIAPVWASQLPDCSNPRDAANTLLALLPPHDNKPMQAATCMDVPPELQADRAELAVKLKKVLDARGYLIRIDDLPGPGEETEHTSYVLVPQLPMVSIERVGDQWLYSRQVVEATPGLYRETFAGLGSWLEEVLPPQFSTAHVAGLYGWQAVLFGVLVALSALLAVALNLVFRRWLSRAFTRLKVPVDSALLDKLRTPARLMAVSAVFLWGIPELQLNVRPAQALLFVARVGLSLGAVLIAARVIDVASRVFADRAAQSETRLDDQAIPLINKLSKVAVVVLGIVFVLSNVGIDVKGLIAGLGIGGVALAFGAQDTVSNLFGGLTVFTDQPFQVGDWVIIDGKVEGTVEEVGFRSTRVRTFYGSVVTVPNSKVANSNVDNMGKRPFRRVKTTLGLTYDTPPDLIQAFVEGVRAILMAHPDTRKDAYEVHFRSFSASSLDVLVYFFLTNTDWNGELTARSEIFRQILRLADDLGVRFAYPSQSLYLESTPERPAPPVQVPDDLRARVLAWGPDGAQVQDRGPTFGPAGFSATANSDRGDTDAN